MKKALILCLALTLIICNFASCGNPSEENSAVSSSSEISETSEEPKIPENVLYYEGSYFRDYTCEPILDTNFVWEAYSERNGIIRYFQNNDSVPENAYFYVGICPTGTNGDMSKAQKYLESHGFLEIENHPMLYDPDYTEGKLTDLEYAQRWLPDIDWTNQRIPWELLECRFYMIGYIPVTAIEKIVTEVDDFDGFESLHFTWMAAPNDQERWLTFDYLYEYSSES